MLRWRRPAARNPCRPNRGLEEASHCMQATTQNQMKAHSFSDGKLCAFCLACMQTMTSSQISTFIAVDTKELGNNERAPSSHHDPIFCPLAPSFIDHLVANSAFGRTLRTSIMAVAAHDHAVPCGVPCSAVPLCTVPCRSIITMPCHAMCGAVPCRYDHAISYKTSGTVCNATCRPPHRLVC